MSGRRSDRERRQRLWDRDPHCYWCGVLTVVPVPEHFKRPPDNQATIDHLRPRTDPSRRIPPVNKERRLVLACRKCNWERNRADHDTLPVEVRRAMTARGKNCGRRPWTVRSAMTKRPERAPVPAVDPSRSTPNQSTP